MDGDANDIYDLLEEGDSDVASVGAASVDSQDELRAAAQAMDRAARGRAAREAVEAEDLARAQQFDRTSPGAVPVEEMPYAAANAFEQAVGAHGCGPSDHVRTRTL